MPLWKKTKILQRSKIYNKDEVYTIIATTTCKNYINNMLGMSVIQNKAICVNTHCITAQRIHRNRSNKVALHISTMQSTANQRLSFWGFNKDRPPQVMA